MKVQNEMATRISINTVGATGSLKGLTDAVRGATNAWKAQVAYQNSVGNSLGAAKAKYEGLGNAIEQQKNKIDELRNRQKELNVTNTESVDKYQKYETELSKLRAEQEKLDTSTREGREQFAALSKQIDSTRESQTKSTGITQKDAEQYLKLDKQINQSENQLRSYEAQQKKASETVKYHESGLAGLQKSYKASDAVSRSFAERLKSEGKRASATVVEYKHLQESLKNLKSQYDIQEKELKQIETASGRASDAYQKQAIRLNETGKQIAETESKTKSMRGEFSKLNPTGINRIDNAVVRVKDHTGSMAEHAKAGFAKFKSAALGASVAVGSLAAGMVKGAKMASTLQNTYTENANLLVSSGEKEIDVQNEINQMRSQGKKLSVEYGVSQTSIAKGYQELIKRGYTGTQSLGAMADMLKASKASGDAFGDTMTVTATTIEQFNLKQENMKKGMSESDAMLNATKKTTNSLASAADLTSAGFDSLGEGMNYVGGVAANAGMNIDQTSAALGELSNRGLEGTRAGTSLARVINRLMQPTTAGAKAMDKYNLSIKDFVDKEGNLKDISDVFELINQHVPKGERVNFFKNLFGAEGQQAASFLASSTGELRELNKQVEESYHNNYVGKLADKNMKSTQNATKQFKEASNAVLIDLGTAMMPALAKTAKGMAKAFNDPDTQRGLKTIASGIGTVADKAVDFVVWLGNHKSEVKTWGEVLLAAFAGKKIIGGVSWLVESMGTIKGLFGGISGLAGKGAISGEMELIANSAKNANSSAGGLLGTFGKMPSSLKMVSGAMAALPAVIDLGSSIANTINTPNTKNKISLASKGLGTGIGGIAGFAIGGPIGAGIGATIGDQLGSSKVAQSIVKKLKDGIDKALNGTKVKAPKMDTKDAESSIKKASKNYKDQQLKDLKTLHDTGNLSDAEYNKRVKAVKDSYDTRVKAIENGEKKGSLVAKYYAQQKQTIDTNYNKERKKIHNKYDTQVLDAEQKFGKNSSQYKSAAAKRDKALDTASSKHKKQISDLNIKYAETDMTAEAKAHLTLTGKIQTQSKKQTSILTKLKDSKGKLSQITVGKMIGDAQKEYKQISKLADQKYNKVTKTAEKQRDKVTDAADRQLNSSVKLAEEQYKKTVAAGNRQYKGNSKWAQAQRKAVKDQAEKQRAAAEKSASAQHEKVVSKAESQYNKSKNAAEKQRSDVTKKAKKQRDDVKEAARSQGYAVSKHAVDQANNSMDSSKKQAVSTQSILNKLAKWWGKFLKWVGVDAPKTHTTDYSYTPAEMHGGFATGGTVSKGSMAFVGEAGPELRYQPYSGVVDIVGRKGAEFIHVSQNDHILNAQDTSKVLSGQFKGTLPGYSTGNISLTSFMSKAKDAASNIWDNISDKAMDVFDKVSDPQKTLTDIASKTFNLDAVKGVGTGARKYSKGLVKKTIDGLVKKFNDLKQAIEDNLGGGGSFDGTMGAHGVYDYLWKIAKKTMSKFGMKFTSGYRPGDPYGHGHHQAIDIAYDASMNGSHKYFDPANWVFTHFPKQVAYVITQGKVRDRKGSSGQPARSSWERWPDNDHYDHLHINGMWGPDDVGKGNAGGAFTGNLRATVIKALRANRLSTSPAMVAKVLSQINTESGGRANAVQPGSDPDGDGSGPALGLMQTKRSTFNANKFSRHGNIFNAYDNLLAALNYAKKRYGKSLYFLGHGHGYANGGRVSSDNLYRLAEGNKPEYVIPTDVSKRPRAWSLLKEVVEQFAGDTETDLQRVSQHGNLDRLQKELEETNNKFDQLLSLVGISLGLSQQQINAVRNIKGYDKKQMYNQQAADQIIADAQNIGGV